MHKLSLFGPSKASTTIEKLQGLSENFPQHQKRPRQEHMQASSRCKSPFLLRSSGLEEALAGRDRQTTSHKMLEYLCINQNKLFAIRFEGGP